MRYFLDQDESSHWYVIPVDKKTEWEEWSELDGDDPAAWDAPEWADRVNGWPGLVSFENYTIR